MRLALKNARAAGLRTGSDFVNEISDRAAEVFDSNRELITDQPSQFHLMLTSYLLSAVQILEVRTTADQAQEIARKAFIDNGRVLVSLFIRGGMLLSKDKFGYILKNTGEEVVKAYGDGFDIEVDTDNATFTTTRVKKCGFHEFFKKNGRPELTSLMCDWDNNWSDTLKTNRHVEFSRPTTIAGGDQSCDFQFKKK